MVKWMCLVAATFRSLGRRAPRRGPYVAGVALAICAALGIALLHPLDARAAATLTVTTIADNTTTDGQCSLREALTNVNSAAQTFADCAAGTGTGDTITFALANPSTITLGSALPAIAKPVRITGPGATALTVSGGGAVQVFAVNSGQTVAIDGLTIANGAAQTGGTCGGGNCGGIQNVARLTVTNSTFSANSVSSFGGGSGGGIYNNGGTATLTSTIVVASTGGGDLSGGGFSGNHNLIDDSTFSQLTGSNNLNSANALLGPLAAYGSTNGTMTFSLLPGSPALDAGDDPTCQATGTGKVNNLDQRGITRPQPSGGHCDIGAFEARFTLTVSGGNNQTAVITQPFAQPLLVTFGGADAPATLSGVVVTFTANPVAGATATLGIPNPATTDGSGRASVAATANGTAGTYTVTASVPSTTPVIFTLTNTGLSGISPASGGTAGGNTVTLTGAGFGTAATTQVLLDGTALPAARIVSVTGAQIVYRAPAHGSGNVTVTVAVGGTTQAGSATYTYGVVNGLPGPQPPGGTPGNPAPLPPARPIAAPQGNPSPLPVPRP